MWVEIELSKKVLRQWLGLEELPNTFWFDMGGSIYWVQNDKNMVGTDLSHVKCGSGPWTTTVRFTGAELTAGEKAYYGLTTPTIPDMIVFGEEYDVDVTCTNGGNCSYTAHTVANEYLVTAGGTKYYHSCATCGAKGLSTFETKDGQFTYQQIEDPKYLKTGPAEYLPCVATPEFYLYCSCGLSSDTFTVEPYGHDLDENTYYTEDKTGHWFLCTNPGCDDTEKGKSVTPHTYDKTVIAEQYLADPKCKESPVYYYSCVCGASSKDYTNNTTFNDTSVEVLEHSFDTTNYKKDNVGHWFECTRDANTCVDDKGASETYETHNYNGVDPTSEYAILVEGNAMTCMTDAVYYKYCVCGASSKDDPTEANRVTFTDEGKAPGPDYDETDVRFDGEPNASTQHYNVCKRDICNIADKKINFTNHVYDQEVVDELYEKVNPECTIKGVYYKSCVCGAFDNSENAATFEIDEDLEVHSFGNTYVNVGTSHAQQCTRCLATGGTTESHSYVSGKCSVCNAAQPVSGGGSVVVPPVEPGTDTTPVEPGIDTTPVEPGTDTTPVVPGTDTTPVVPGTDTTPVVPGTDTTPVESESVAETTPVVSDTETEPAATESDSVAETEPTDDSCGGTVSIMGLALVAALGACGVVATKKKEEDQ